MRSKLWDMLDFINLLVLVSVLSVVLSVVLSLAFVLWLLP